MARGGAPHFCGNVKSTPPLFLVYTFVSVDLVVVVSGITRAVLSVGHRNAGTARATAVQLVAKGKLYYRAVFYFVYCHF
jgi:hypothetical protein